MAMTRGMVVAAIKRAFDCENREYSRTLAQSEELIAQRDDILLNWIRDEPLIGVRDEQQVQEAG